MTPLVGIRLDLTAAHGFPPHSTAEVSQNLHLSPTCLYRAASSAWRSKLLLGVLSAGVSVSAALSGGCSWDCSVQGQEQPPKVQFAA